MKKSYGGAKRPMLLLLVLMSVFSLVAAACGSESSSSTGADEEDTSSTDGDGESESDSDGQKIKVALVGNNQMQDIADLTPELFTEETGIEVEFTILKEGDLREIVTRDVNSEGGQFDVVQIGMYEAPQFGADGLLTDLSALAEGDEEYDVDDILEPVRNGLSSDGVMYAAPFYAESSFVMYRQDVMDENGITISDNPTWDEIAEVARQINTDEMAGICLRGLPGWGDLGASFTTVLNTFGGTWWEANDDGSIGAAQVDQPEFAEALNFYVGLVDDAGQADAANSSFPECLSLYQEGKVAMWYDATVAASILEGDDSPVKGQNGFANAPTKATDSSGWLWSWAMGIPEANENKEAAWEFVRWATSKQYIEQAAENLDSGWAAVPPGTRASTYENPEYQEAASAFAERTLSAINGADPTNPGTTPRPGVGGVQFVGVPEWQDVGDRCTEELSTAFGGGDVDAAIAACQEIASSASS